MDGQVTADVIASVANNAAKLPRGSAIIVDDFHVAAPTVSTAMADLVECWPAENVQLVLASRFEPQLRMHRMRMGGELCEIRDQDMYFSLDDSRRLLVNFGVEISDADLGLLYERSEGWPAAVQMVALSLRGADPARVAQALQVCGHAIGEYFVDEVLSQQPPRVTRFMLDTSVLDELTVGACAAVTARQDAAALLHGVDDADLFVVALDEGRTSFRYHHLLRQTLRAELRASDPVRERVLQLRVAEWFESTGDARRAARHFMAARQSRRALALLRDKSVVDFLQNPARPAPLDVSEIRPESIMDAPDELLTLATDLLLSSDIAHGGQYLDLFERIPPARLEPALEARLAVSPSKSCPYRSSGRPCSSSWRCWTGPRSGPPEGGSAKRWPRSSRRARPSRNRAWHWWPGPMSRRRYCGYRSAIRDPRRSWPAGCGRALVVTCCWPESRSPQATTTPLRSSCTHGHRMT
jgi:LuxR family maltose regulon positive regulatory protein